MTDNRSAGMTQQQDAIDSDWLTLFHASVHFETKTLKRSGSAQVWQKNTFVF